MSRLSSYLLRQLIGPVVLFTFLLVCVVWLTQSLRLLDLVINRGQSAGTFLYLTVLILPNLLIIILPFSFFAGALYIMSRLSSDSELVVMSAAGVSRVQLAVPVFVAAGAVMALTYLCGLYLMPVCQRELKDKVVGIRADIGATLFSEGAFNTPVKGLTVYIREIDMNGGMRGILVHDSRNPKNQISYLATDGTLAQTPEGPRLIMHDGTVEQTAGGGARLSILRFDRYVFDLDQFVGATPVVERASNEQFLGALLNPDPGLKPRTRRAYLAEAHNRITQPLYCLPFALIAMAAMMRSRRARGAHALRMTAAWLAAALLRIAGYGAQGLAAGNSALCALFYIIPLAGTLAALAAFTGHVPRLSSLRWRGGTP